jgi:hypothetical protein
MAEQVSQSNPVAERQERFGAIAKAERDNAMVIHVKEHGNWPCGS